MKINEIDKPDKYGIYPCCTVSGKDVNPQNISEWLFRNYQGYKFAMIFDCMQDEFEEPEKNTQIYFLDTLTEELLEYAGVEAIKKWLIDKEQKQTK